MSILSRTGTTERGVHFAVIGERGPPLFFGFPVTATPHALPIPGTPLLDSVVASFADRYQILVADYPSIGRSRTVMPDEFTASRVCNDLLEVADAVGFSHFAWWGGTFGAIAGLQLATRTSRLSAFISAGWPPLGAPYAQMLQGVRLNAPDPPPHALAMLRDPAQYAQWITFYESLEHWDESNSVAHIRCPKQLIYGATANSDVAGIPLQLADRIRRHRSELERLGWSVTEVADQDESLMLQARAWIAPAREFLDNVFFTERRPIQHT